MKLYLSIIACLCWCVTIFAQENDGIGNIDAQRPTLTESYSIILPNMLQFENGLDFINNKAVYNTFLRGSVTDKIELRASTDYSNLSTVGAKFVVMNPEKTSLGIGTSFIYSRNLIDNTNDFRLAMSKSFSNFFVTYNLGHAANFYTIFLVGTSITEKVNGFIEYYYDSFMNRVHSGITWIAHKDIQLDVNGGWIGTDVWYAGLGVSFRLR
ncbi:hypothetical protein ACQY1Q_03545 [Tenacibaculum sp. TC6]|uniref:hypothetical protein n=1 Tax=Tenacibaculum sp. TC6 TaxID=3423223 RepID=UPI003D360960